MAKKQTTNTMVQEEYLSGVLVRPHITEKAARLGENSVYTFEVRPDANKIQVKKAVQFVYGVTPKKVRIVRNRPRLTLRRGRKAHKKGFKKALVQLQKGDTLNLLG